MLNELITGFVPRHAQRQRIFQPRLSVEHSLNKDLDTGEAGREWTCGRENGRLAEQGVDSITVWDAARGWPKTVYTAA